MLELLRETFTYFFYKPSECFDVEDKENVTSTLGLRTFTRNFTDFGKVQPENQLPEFNFFRYYENERIAAS